MNARAHVILGAGSVVAANYVHHFLRNDWLTLGLAITAGMLGALTPDIDHPESTLSHSLRVAHGDGCMGWLGGIFRAVLGGHRGITHTLAIVIVLLFVVLRFAGPHLLPYGLAYVIGYASHLVADLGAGIPLLWPLTERRIKL